MSLQVQCGILSKYSQFEDCVWTAKEGRLNKLNQPNQLGLVGIQLGKYFIQLGNMLRQFCKNGHPGGKLTWITLQRMAQLVWYIWCKEAKKISQFAPRTNLSTVVGDAEKEGERKKKIQRHDSTELLCCCREVSSARHGTRSMMGVVIGMFISRVWD